MSTIVTGTIPADDFLLGHTMEEHPSLRFEVEPVVGSGKKAPMPLLWVRGGDADSVAETLRVDPAVSDAEPLGNDAREILFRVTWGGMSGLLVQMVTNSRATILDATGVDGEWHLRVLYPERNLFSKTHDFCKEHGVDFDVDTIRELDEESGGRYDLTQCQFEVLQAAAQQGYFDVPREVNLQELADELDVSHQALSERLRRGTASLIDESLNVG